MTTTRQTKRLSEASALLLPFDGESSLQPGDSVRFYQNGWRYGELDSIAGKDARILYGGHMKTVPIGDVEKYRQAKDSPSAEPGAGPVARARSSTTG